jgi:2-phosphosulfolactate phosphatase
LEVLFSPAELAVLKERDLSGTICVVFDVLRATSSMVTALSNGASAILPVAGIPEALKVRQREPEVLLAGERDGLRIRSNLTGSIDFDLGNSPREFTRDRVSGKNIVMTTTNGTQALRACAQAKAVFVSCFLNLRTTSACVQEELGKSDKPDVILVCSGTLAQAAYEDVLAAGALCDALWDLECLSNAAIADSAKMARSLFQLEQDDLSAALKKSRNGLRLLSRPELAADVDFCAQRDASTLVVEMGRDGLCRMTND